MLVQGTAYCVVSCKALPGYSVDVDSLRVSHADVFLDATILHTVDMTNHHSLSRGPVHIGKASIRQGISVGHFILSGYAKDTTDASQVVVVGYSLLHGIYMYSMCLAARQQCAGNAGIVEYVICCLH